MPKKYKKKSGLSWKDIRNAIIFGGSLYSLYKQITAPNCPHCNTKLVFINNYCINCHTSWQLQK